MASKLRLFLLFFSCCILTAKLCAFQFSDQKVLDYIIGEGDIIKVEFTSPRFLSQTLTVDNKGYVKLSMLGKIKVSNKTLKQLSTELETLYSKSLKKADIEVALVKSYKSEQMVQNSDFQNKLDTIKEFYFSRDYQNALKETKSLLDLIKAVNDRDNQVRDIPKNDLEFLEVKTRLTKKETMKFFDISGKLRNNVNTRFNWIKVRISFYDADNKVESVKDHYIVKDKPIYQTQIIPFEIKGVAPVSAERAELELYDYLIDTGDNENQTKKGQ